MRSFGTQTSAGSKHSGHEINKMVNVSQVKGIFFAKVNCTACALRIKFAVIYLIDKLVNTENALNVLKPDTT
jgi:hypothetical protein